MSEGFNVRALCFLGLVLYKAKWSTSKISHASCGLTTYAKANHRVAQMYNQFVGLGEPE